MRVALELVIGVHNPRVRAMLGRDNGRIRAEWILLSSVITDSSSPFTIQTIWPLVTMLYDAFPLPLLPALRDGMVPYGKNT